MEGIVYLQIPNAVFRLCYTIQLVLNGLVVDQSVPQTHHIQGVFKRRVLAPILSQDLSLRYFVELCSSHVIDLICLCFIGLTLQCRARIFVANAILRLEYL